MAFSSRNPVLDLFQDFSKLQEDPINWLTIAKLLFGK